jgi:hypothetical protein
VYLRFHHPDRAPEFLCRFHGLLYGECRDATWNGNSKLAQDLLALVFMYFHKNSLSIRRLPPLQNIMHAPIGLNWHEMYHAALHQNA